MNLGYRIYAVVDNNLKLIPQKRNNNRHSELFPEFSGQTVKIVYAAYWVKNRRPYKLHSLSGTIYKFKEDGHYDCKWEQWKATQIPNGYCLDLAMDSGDYKVTEQDKTQKRFYDRIRETTHWNPDGYQKQIKKMLKLPEHLDEI